MVEKLNPKRFDISLVFFRNNNKYPQKGSIVRMDHEEYCEHIEEIEEKRSEPNVLKNGETFCVVTQSYQKMLYENYYNKTYPYLRSDIPMIVEEVFFEGKKIMARCKVNGYQYPKDSIEDMKVVVCADDLQVVDIVLCDYVSIFSDQKPSGDTEMGFLDTHTSRESGVNVYQTFKVRENYEYTKILTDKVIENGLKEFSFIYPIDPVTKKPIYLDGYGEPQQTVDPTSTQQAIKDIEGSIESLSMEHALSLYTRRMFASIMENIDRTQVSDEMVNNIYFDMLSVMKNSMISNNMILMPENDIDLANNVDLEY